MKTTIGSILLTAALLLGTSCTTAPAPEPNVVLIVIDTLRPDHLPFVSVEILSNQRRESTRFGRSSWLTRMSAIGSQS